MKLSGLIFLPSGKNTFISFAIRTPDAVATPNAITPMSTIMIVLSDKNVVAVAVAPTEIPRQTVRYS